MYFHVHFCYLLDRKVDGCLEFRRNSNLEQKYIKLKTWILKSNDEKPKA